MGKKSILKVVITVTLLFLRVTVDFSILFFLYKKPVIDYCDNVNFYLNEAEKV